MIERGLCLLFPDLHVSVTSILCALERSKLRQSNVGTGYGRYPIVIFTQSGGPVKKNYEISSIISRQQQKWKSPQKMRGVTPKNARSHPNACEESPQRLRGVTPTPARSHPKNGEMAPHQTSVFQK